MTDRDVLYAAVLAAPDDDTPRLAFADYLDDTGSRADAIRARFVRNQVALARTEPGTAEHDRLFRAAAPVEFHYRPEWAAGVEGTIAMSVRLVRGFVGAVTCRTETFLSEGERLFRSHPVRAVTLYGLSGYPDPVPVGPVAASPLLAHLHSLDVSPVLPDDGFLADLAASPHAAGLTRLGVRWGGYDGAPAEDLADLLLPNLTALDLSGNRAVGDAAVRALADRPAFANLHTLDLSGTGVSPVGLAALGASPHAAGLTDIRVGNPGARVEEGWGVALARAPHLRGLTDLALAGNAVGPRDGERFAAGYAWPALRRLSLRGSAIRIAGVRALAANPLLRSLVEIDLRDTAIASADAKPLRHAFPELRVLTDDCYPFVRVGLAPEDRP